MLGVAEGPLAATAGEVGVEREVAFEVEVVVAEGAEAGDVVVADVDACALGNGEGAVQIQGVPQHHGVQDQPESTELVLGP